MTVTAAPWNSMSTATGADVTLALVPPDVLAALADGDLPTARTRTALPLTEYLVHQECRGVWRRRLDQIAGDPDDGIWVTRFVLTDSRSDSPLAIVGRAGFHGAPDDRGMVEVGYAIDPRCRRRGHARSALRVLLATADADPRVRVVRATVSPDNDASRALIDTAGFVPVGEQWDDEDGLEIVLERDVGEAPTGRPPGRPR